MGRERVGWISGTGRGAEIGRKKGEKEGKKGGIGLETGNRRKGECYRLGAPISQWRRRWP